MYQNRDFNKIRIVFGYEFLPYTLVAISIDSDNFTCYLNPIIIILYKVNSTPKIGQASRKPSIMK